MTSVAVAESVKERPILFSSPMVKAILEGRKTQTRRVMKPQPEHCPKDELGDPSGFWWRCKAVESMVTISQLNAVDDCWAGMIEHVNPYGKVGDRLWLRETWLAAYAGSYQAITNKSDIYRNGCVIQYAASDSDYHQSWDTYKGKWRPSIFMPRWASRITLEITKVRVERVQSISQEDAIAEGCEGTECYRSPRFIGYVTDSGQLPAEEYRILWEKINYTRGFGWEKNPFVWVLEFRRLKP